MSSSKQVDDPRYILSQYLPDDFMDFVENNYYAKTNQSMLLENLVADDEFLKTPETHLALYTDHGVVHVRDVAINTLKLLEQLNGTLIKKRNRIRLEYMKGYGVLIAYLHDAGMCINSHFGRAMHAEYIAHELYSKKFQSLLEKFWINNEVNLRTRIGLLRDNNNLSVPGPSLLRELLAMAVCHSKSFVKAQVLSDRKLLQEIMKQSLCVSLSEQYLGKLECHPQRDKLLAKMPSDIEESKLQHQTLISNYYHDFEEESFAWLLTNNRDDKDFVSDIIDTIRVLRCADALRQRGTALKTSGSYPILVDKNTSHAIYSFYTSEGENILYEVDNPLNAGEANIANSSITEYGELKFSFFLGSFSSQKACVNAAKSAALVIDDIQRDVIDSLEEILTNQSKTLNIAIEQIEDNHEFSGIVVQELIKLNPELTYKTMSIPIFSKLNANEKKLFYSGLPAHKMPVSDLKKWVRNLRFLKLNDNDIKTIFFGVKLVQLSEGEILFSELDPSYYVYIAMDDGLEGIPLGGYQHFVIKPWTLIGHLGVIRQAERNSTIVSSKDVSLLMIPKTVYFKYWHVTFKSKTFIPLIKKLFLK